MLTFHDWQDSILKKTKERLKNLRVPAPQGFVFAWPHFVKIEDGIRKESIIGDENGVRVFSRHVMDVENQTYRVCTLTCIGIKNSILFSINEAEAKGNYFNFYGIKNEYQELFEEITSIKHTPPFTVYNIRFKGHNNLMFLPEFIAILNTESPQELDQALFVNKKLL